MNEYGRRLTVHLRFEAAVGEVCRAIRDEGLQVVGRIDVRDQFRQNLRTEFRQYVLIEVWSPEFAFEALRQNPDVGPLLPTTFAVYELAADETIVLVTGQRRKKRGPTRIADEEITRIGQVFHRLERAVPCHSAASAA